MAGMNTARRALIILFALVAGAALVATWSENLAYFAGGAGPMAFLRFIEATRANPASRSITMDLGFLLIAAVAFMAIEARRLGVRFVWLYVIFGWAVAISVTFPLFMIARELRLAKTDATPSAWRLTAGDLLLIAGNAGLVLALNAYLLGFIG